MVFEQCHFYVWSWMCYLLNSFLGWLITVWTSIVEKDNAHKNLYVEEYYTKLKKGDDWLFFNDLLLIIILITWFYTLKIFLSEVVKKWWMHDGGFSQIVRSRSVTTSSLCYMNPKSQSEHIFSKEIIRLEVVIFKINIIEYEKLCFRNIVMKLKSIQPVVLHDWTSLLIMRMLF